MLKDKLHWKVARESRIHCRISRCSRQNTFVRWANLVVLSTLNGGTSKKPRLTSKARGVGTHPECRRANDHAATSRISASKHRGGLTESILFRERERATTYVVYVVRKSRETPRKRKPQIYLAKPAVTILARSFLGLRGELLSIRESSGDQCLPHTGQDLTRRDDQ